MSLHPIRTSNAIAEAYYGYLGTSFEFADARLHRQFQEALRQGGNFVSGPFVQATPPFKTTYTIAELVEEGILSPLFARCSDKMSMRLYQHQEEAIRKMILGERNLVVATGTGSGKTECFMIPICNYLFREYEAGTLTPGIRALLLYPMNALANDQVNRLHSMFESFEFITFGRYTGETKHREKDALESYRSMFQRDPLPNEMISREQMQQSPPHILITNYAMLEYLLLRPADNVFFDGPDANWWRFIILDEAHTYSGIKGIETAMLLRRVKDRVRKDDTQRLQCVATSATLGRGIDDAQGIMEFASQLFSEDFVYVPGDNNRQDLVVATRQSVNYGVVWGKPERSLYAEWVTLLKDETEEVVLDRLIAAGKLAGVPVSVLVEAKKRAGSSLDAFLYAVLQGDENMVRMQEILEDNPITIVELAECMFEQQLSLTEAETTIVSLVDLAVRARPTEDSNPLLPARYHLMLRALNGAWLSFVPEPKLHLVRTTTVPYAGGAAPAYEIGVCSNCGTPYIQGAIDEAEDGLGRCLSPVATDESSLQYYAVCNIEEWGRLEANEDEGIYALDPDTQAYMLCPVCGKLRNEEGVEPDCSCGVKQILLIQTKAQVTRCAMCGASATKHGIVRRVSTSSEAASSVIATALYQELHVDDGTSQKADVPMMPDFDDDWDNYIPEVEEPGKKLLVFSDSRQDAAYFAPYMQDSYERVLWRNLILTAAREAINEQPELPLSVSDLWRRASQMARPVFEKSARDINIDAQAWVLNEFTRPGRHGLETLGLLGFVLERPPRWRTARFYERSLGLTDGEVWDLINILLGTLRRSGAVCLPREGLDLKHEALAPGNLTKSIRLTPGSKQGIMGWMPQAGSNGRADYLKRLMHRLGYTGNEKEHIWQILEQMWKWEFAPHLPDKPWSKYFATYNPQNQQGIISYQLVAEKWHVLAYDSHQFPVWHICDQCGSLTLHNIRGVCPKYRCQGTLSPVDISERLARNHYVRLYVAPNLPKKMNAKEHTAQLTPDAASSFQTDFQKGLINILSCSTTFELGVDLGDLEAVLMKNVPPSPANYVQRAGRAGRRAGTAAMVVSYAQDRPHDSFHYWNPDLMIKGHITPPHFDLRNEKIVLRHVYAVALAEFWRNYPEYVGNVGGFFEDNGGGAGVDILMEYLALKPSIVQQRINHVVPDGLKEQLGVDSWQWVKRLLAPLDALEPGPLTCARYEVEDDLRRLEARNDELAKKYISTAQVVYLMNTIKRRPLINFLASRNVLPRYGFPVDVVNLDLKSNASANSDIELERSLRMAVSEYAPDSEVVAGGKVWTSRYLQVYPQRRWLRYLYGECKLCRNYVTELDTGDGSREVKCDTCGNTVKCVVFVVPEFGFLADPKEPAEAGSRNLKRVYAGRVSFSGIETNAETIENSMVNGMVQVLTSKQGKLAVVNNAGGRGYLLCPSCGYAAIGGSRQPVGTHKTPYGRDCRRRLEWVALGYEFRSDIARIEFGLATPDTAEFWYSLLYALIEGACLALEVHRSEIDGCIQWGSSPGLPTSLVLFDAVAGGVGHVQQLGKPSKLTKVLEAAYRRMDACNCDSSCYCCLRNYSNQFYHDVLNRGVAKTFLGELLGRE
ncbi:MAG: DEAD/DEAH box helicase [Limnochordia bacterium]|jgi:hypothetical protein